MNWDYIIVGAGSAGCALAHELATSGRNPSILILEAGGSDFSPVIKIPAGVLAACKNFDWGYTAEPDTSRSGAVEPWIRGKVLGGCSSINGTIYMRGAAEDFDRWGVLCAGTGGWSAREVIPLFRELERSDQPGPARGTAGQLYVRTVRRPHRISQAFLAAARAAGYPLNEDYNGDSQEGVGLAQMTQRRGFRCSAAAAFLKPVLRYKGVKLVLNAHVLKVEISRGRATGVAFHTAGTMRSENARHVILCAGALNSPKLLMLSGVGDPDELRRHHIAVKIENSSVGRNFRDHPLLRMTYRTKVPTYNPTEGVLQKLGFLKDFVRYGEGPIANLFEAVGAVRSSAEAVRPDIQLVFLPVGYSKSSEGCGMAIADHPSVTLTATHSYPRGTGRIRLRSARPEDPPIIDYAMLADPVDVATLARSVRVMRNIMNTEPIAHLVEETTPGNAVMSESAVEEFIRRDTTICYHSMGTCRMGAESSSVVTPELRVRGTENLWIADASIIPEPISANLNAACMMIGKRLGQRLSDKNGTDRSSGG